MFSGPQADWNIKNILSRSRFYWLNLSLSPSSDRVVNDAACRVAHSQALAKHTTMRKVGNNVTCISAEISSIYSNNLLHCFRTLQRFRLIWVEIFRNFRLKFERRRSWIDTWDSFNLSLPTTFLFQVATLLFTYNGSSIHVLFRLFFRKENLHERSDKHKTYFDWKFLWADSSERPLCSSSTAQ